MRAYLDGTTAAVLLVFSSVSAQPQQATPHDHLTFACAADGLSAGKATGCKRLAQPVVTNLSDEPVYWHLTSFRRRNVAEAAKRKGDAVVAAEGRIWLSSLGAIGDTALG